MGWDEFSSRVWGVQIGFMGEPSEAEAGPGPGRGSFHENPFSCICRNYEDRVWKEGSDEAFSNVDEGLI